MDKTTRTHEHADLCDRIENEDWPEGIEAAAAIDSLHARIAELEAGYPDIDEPEPETTNARLRDELAAARFRIMRIQNTATDARQRIETTLNDTKTDGVHYADQWPVKGQGETP